MCKWVLDMTGETQVRPHGVGRNRLVQTLNKGTISGGLQQCCAGPM